MNMFVTLYFVFVHCLFTNLLLIINKSIIVVRRWQKTIYIYIYLLCYFIIKVHTQRYTLSCDYIILSTASHTVFQQIHKLDKIK